MNFLIRILIFPIYLTTMVMWFGGTIVRSIYGYFIVSADLKFKIRWFKDFYPAHIKSRMEKVAFHEYVFNIGTGKLGSLIGLVNKVGWGTIILGALNLDRFIYLVPIAMLSYPIVAYVFGYFLHHIKYIYRQGDVNNRLLNPQIVRIEEKLKEFKN